MGVLTGSPAIQKEKKKLKLGRIVSRKRFTIRARVTAIKTTTVTDVEFLVYRETR
jgi:hypothetical protein